MPTSGTLQLLFRISENLVRHIKHKFHLVHFILLKNLCKVKCFEFKVQNNLRLFFAEIRQNFCSQCNTYFISMRYTFAFFMLYLPETTNTLLFMETMIGPGKVRRGVPFQAMKESFSIGETASGYTLYKSVSCESAKAGKQAWDAAQGDVPSGWKACSDPIPADTQHNVYDVVPGEWFYLMGVTDNEINVRNLI